MIYLTTLVFTVTFVLALRLRRKRLAAERKRQIVQTWPRAVAAFIDPVPKNGEFPVQNPPKVEYGYSVRGVRYAGRYLSPAQEVITIRTDERALQHLRSAAQWRIYYNPADPAEAYLSPGPPRINNVHLALDFFFLVFAPVVLLFCWHGIITHS